MHSTQRPIGIIVMVGTTIAISATIGTENLRANEMIAGVPHRCPTLLPMDAIDSMLARVLWPMTRPLIGETHLLITASAMFLLRDNLEMPAPPRA